MKRLLLMIIICLIVALAGEGQTQQGYVKTIGKPGKKGVALSGVTVRVKGGHNVRMELPTFSHLIPSFKYVVQCC